MGNRFTKIILDLLLLGGWAAVIYGCWQLYIPLAYVVAGTSLMAFSIMATNALRSDNNQGRKP